jgi:hypothetical protein
MEEPQVSTIVARPFNQDDIRVGGIIVTILGISYTVVAIFILVVLWLCGIRF